MGMETCINWRRSDLLGEKGMKHTLTQKAKAMWEAIPSQRQEMLLRNVWCPNCAKATTMTHFTGQVETGDLVLTGTCATCGGRVARVIEHE